MFEVRGLMFDDANPRSRLERRDLFFRLVILLPVRSVYHRRKIEYNEGGRLMFTTKGYAAYSAHEPLKPFSFERREPTPD